MRKMQPYAIVFMLFLLLVGMGVSAQRPISYKKPLRTDPQARFVRLTTEDGLSNNRILDILQDRNGFIWIATLEGLNKYDGSTFEIFKHSESDSSSLSSNLITTLLEDKQGNLFIGTDKGLHRYNKKNNHFEAVVLKGEAYDTEQPYIRKVIEGPNNSLWISDVDGFLINYNTRTKHLVNVYKHQKINQPYYYYSPLYYDNDSTLWVGGRNVDPTYLDENADKLVSLGSDRDDYSMKRENDVACYYEDSRRTFWVTALDGIYTLDKASEVFTKFLGVSTWDVHEAKSGLLWFATGSGVYQMDPTTGLITAFENQKDNPSSLSNNNVLKICEDSRGNLWFATRQGVSIYAPPELPFGPYTHLPGVQNSPEGRVVTAVFEDQKNNLWIGYQNSGLDYFDPKEENFYHYNTETSELASNKISALFIDSKKRLWVGLWAGVGFHIYDDKTQGFELHTYGTNTFALDWYNDFAEDDLGQFYLGFWGADGLCKFDPESGKFGENFRLRFPRIQVSRLVTRLLKDNKGNLWVGTTAAGVHRYFPEQDSTASYFADDTISSGLTSNAIADITQVPNGDIWLISNSLQRYLPESDSFISFGLEHGLGSERLVSLLADDYGNIWVATQYDGLYRFNIEKESFKQFSKEDGLQSNSFTAARYKLASGDLFFGGQNGFNLFDPSAIHWRHSFPKASFGRMFVFDEIRVHDLNEVQFVNLSPGENVFTIELGSYERVVPEKYVYQCKLEGHDQDWVTLDSKQRQRRFAGIAPGRYTFYYRIGNKDGLWYRQSLKIVLNLRTPFYKTWWFISFSVIVLIVIVYFIVQRRLYDLKQKQRGLELQQKLFRLQMNPHFMFNSLLAIQNYIFMKNTKEAGNFLSDFARLFRLILDHSKVEFVPMEKELETLELYLTLQKLRYQDKFTYHIELDEEIDVELFQIPPMLAQPMIENALEHGLFYKKDSGNIWIRFKLDKDAIVFEVQDDGVGLSETRKKEPLSKDHKSSALEITRERINILGKKHKYFVFFELKETKDSEGNVSGTIVRFNIPYKPYT